MRPFEQLDNSYAKAAGGTGLGLSLVEALTKLHGGSLLILTIHQFLLTRGAEAAGR
jgi:signal transduction histidine kinase